MIILNFSHPLTPAQLAQLETLTQQRVERVVEKSAQFDHAQPFAEQARALVDAVGLSPQEWQSAPLVVVPPALSFIAVVVLAELHGRMGYFPTVARLRPLTGTTPPQFEIAEVIGLQSVRDGARERR
jgi:hypothetical protein